MATVFLVVSLRLTALVHIALLTTQQDVGAAAARKDDSFQQEGVKDLAASKKEKHWREGGKF